MAAEKPKPKPPAVELPKLPAVELPKPPAVELPKPAEVKEAATDAVQAAKDAAPASVKDVASEAAKGAAKAPSANPFSFFGGAPLTRACKRTTCPSSGVQSVCIVVCNHVPACIAPPSEHGLLAANW